MKAMEKFEFVDKNLILNMDDQAVIQLTCSKHAVKVLLDFLSYCKCLGDAGSSRTVTLECGGRGNCRELFFDGDGSDHIYALTLNGRSLDEWVDKQTKRNEHSQKADVDARQTESPETTIGEAERQAEIHEAMNRTEADTLAEAIEHSREALGSIGDTESDPNKCSHPNMHNIYPSGADQPGDRPSGQRCPECGRTDWF